MPNLRGMKDKKKLKSPSEDTHSIWKGMWVKTYDLFDSSTFKVEEINVCMVRILIFPLKRGYFAT